MSAKKGSSPYDVWTRPTDWKPLPSPKDVKPKKFTKKLGKTNHVNA